MFRMNLSWGDETNLVAFYIELDLFIIHILLATCKVLSEKHTKKLEMGTRDVT
jgi:hypothetical protein